MLSSVRSYTLFRRTKKIQEATLWKLYYNSYQCNSIKLQVCLKRCISFCGLVALLGCFFHCCLFVFGWLGYFFFFSLNAEPQATSIHLNIFKSHSTWDIIYAMHTYTISTQETRFQNRTKYTE